MKIFKKVKKGNKRKIYFLGIKIFSYKKHKKINKDKAIFDYIKKYSYVLDNMAEAETSDEYKDVIWQIWLQGEESAPPIVKKCLASVKKHHPEKNVIILNKDNITDFIKIPDYINEKYRKGIIPHAHFSDYIRVCLLVKYGGIWVDATVLLTDKIPQDLLSQDFFMFKSIPWINILNVPSVDMINLLPNIGNKHISGSNWFFISNKNSHILKTVKCLLEEYWKNENILIDYFIFHYFVSYSVMNCPKCKESFEKMKSVPTHQPHLLQSQLLKEYDENLFNEIKSLTSIHKLTYKDLEKDIFPNSYLKEILKYQ